MTDVYGKDIAFKEDFVLTPTGDLDTIEGLENVRDALYRRLVTSPGSLVHRPDYGVGLKSYQNAINSIDTRRKLALSIAEQFRRDPRVEAVTGVSAEIDDGSGMVQIDVKVRLVGFGEQSMTFQYSGE